MARLSLSEIIATPTVKTGIIAMAITFIYSYLMFNTLPGAVEIISALVISAIIGYAVDHEADSSKDSTHFITGMLVYFAYEGVKLYMKLSTEIPSLQVVFTKSLLLGLVTVGVFWVYKRF